MNFDVEDRETRSFFPRLRELREIFLSFFLYFFFYKSNHEFISFPWFCSFELCRRVNDLRYFNLIIEIK